MTSGNILGWLSFFHVFIRFRRNVLVSAAVCRRREFCRRPKLTAEDLNLRFYVNFQRPNLRIYQTDKNLRFSETELYRSSAAVVGLQPLTEKKYAWSSWRMFFLQRAFGIP